MLCVCEEESRYASREPGRTCRCEVVCMLKLECDSERLRIANDIGLVLRKKKDLTNKYSEDSGRMNAWQYNAALPHCMAIKLCCTKRLGCVML